MGQSLIKDWYPDYGGTTLLRNVGTLLSDHKEPTLMRMQFYLNYVSKTLKIILLKKITIIEENEK
jgi:hypothetical protein